MKKLSLYVFLVLLFFPAKLYAKTFSWKDYTSNVKKMQITSKNMQALLNEMILKISEDCCEKNFQNKERLLLIKTNMNTCLEEDCHKKSFLFYIDFASLSNNDIIKYLGYTVIILFLVKNVFLILLLRYQSFFFRSVKVKLSEKLFDYYINVPYDYYIKGNPSVIVRNLINEIQSVYGYINNLMIFYREILAVLVILVLLIFINPKIVFFLLLLFVIFSLIYQKLINLSELKYNLL